MFYGPLHTNEQVLGDQLELLGNSSVRTQDIARETCQMRWTIETNGEIGSGKSLLEPGHDDDDDDDDDDINSLSLFNAIS